MIVVGISPDGQDAWGVDQVTVEDSFREELDMQLDPRKLPVIPLVVGWESIDVDGFYDSYIPTNLVQVWECRDVQKLSIRRYVGKYLQKGIWYIPVASWHKE